jgi:membrane protein
MGMTDSPEISKNTGPELSARFSLFLPFLGYVWTRFANDRCWRMAAGLSYTSLLAIVPLTAIAFSMLAAFPVFEGVKEQFQDAVFANLLPQSAEAMQDYFTQFIHNTTGLSAVGIVALAATAVLLLGTIEADLNAIFRVERPRALLGRLLVFWAMISLGPLLLGASFSLSTYFFAATEWLGVDLLTGPLGLLTQSVPTLIIMILLSSFYMAIPNRPISLRAACIGGVSAGFLFATLREIFGWYVATFPTYQNIYGALSVVPIFLVWMYLSWTLVLLGAVLTASLGEWQSANGKPLDREMRAGAKMVLSLRILNLLYQASQSGDAVTRKILLGTLGGGEEALEKVLIMLDEAGFARRAEKGDWVLSRDLTTATLHDLYYALHLGLRTEDTDVGEDQNEEHWREALSQQLKQLQIAQQNATDVVIRDLIDGHLTDAAIPSEPSNNLRSVP